jgi:arylsulfatase A
LPRDAGEDSVSILPVLLNPRRREPVRAGVVLHSVRGAFGLRHGDWKLIPTRGSGGFSAPSMVEAKVGEPAGQLYNLRTDPRETRNVFDEHPDVVKRLLELLDNATKRHRTRPAAI